MRTHGHSRGSRFLAAILAASAWWGGGRAAAAQERVSVEPATVSAGTFFEGATLHVTGTAGESSQVVVRVMGPPERLTYNRRAKIGGLIWGGVEHVSFEGAPSVYRVYASAALSSLAAPATRSDLVLGYDALGQRITVHGGSDDPSAVVRNFVRLKEKERLYGVEPGGVHLDDPIEGRRRFHAQVPLPATVPAGAFEVSVFEFDHGALVSTATGRATVARVGLPATLYDMAHRHGFLFGILSVVVSLTTGLGTGLLANRKRLVRRRPHAAGSAEAGGEGEGQTAEDVADTPLIGPVLRTFGSVLKSRPFGPSVQNDVALIREKYAVFRNLLALNSELLELLSELEEEWSWTTFRHTRVRMGIRALLDGTGDLVRLLNQLTDDRYFDLVNVVSGIRHDVLDFLAKNQQEVEAELTLCLCEITSANADLVGGKALNLARVECDLHARVPDSFVVTTEAYRQFLEHGGLGGKLRAVLAPARLDAPDDFGRRCDLAQTLVDEAEVPLPVREAIEKAWAGCIPEGQFAALRSSAAGEDSELSFAGQFETVLNVPRADVVAAWKRVVRSRLAARAVFYRRAAGLAEVDTPMAVLVQRMVRSRASGVLFTRRPDDPKAPVVVVSSVLGLGLDASTGMAQADEVIVSRKSPRRVVERRLARKAERLACADGGGLAREPVDAEAQTREAVSDEAVFALVDRALAIEQYYGQPQDIEWTVDDDGQLYILQARPLRTAAAEAVTEPVPAGAPLLFQGGEPVWFGRAVGPAFMPGESVQAEDVPSGCILVVPRLLPDCVRFLPRVCGIVVERGTITGHVASIVREFRVPSLFAAEGATAKLVAGEVVSLDVATRSVFAGALWPELRGHLPLTLEARRTIGLAPVLASKVTKLSGSSFLSSWACQSLHDVIRYAHEMAILAMFNVGDSLLESSSSARRLDSPMYVHLLDLGGGLRPGARPRGAVKVEDVACRPFNALLAGWLDEATVRPVSEVALPRSFGSVMMTGISSHGARELGAPNYACVTECYLNLNSRQAYHYAIVDAFLCEHQNSNHITVRLKGGGAAPWQRELRGRFMAEVLRIHGFTATVTGDILNAWCRGIDQPAGERLLATVGQLLRFSGQLDVMLEDEAKVREYVAAFVEAQAQSAGARPSRPPARLPVP